MYLLLRPSSGSSITSARFSKPRTGKLSGVCELLNYIKVVALMWPVSTANLDVGVKHFA